MVLSAKYADAEQFNFGDSPEMADELLALVIAGTKTATCGALRDYDGTRDTEILPQVGCIDIVTDGAGKPACAIKTVEVEIRKFCDVPETFALAEGEGDFYAWRKGHIEFFERNGGWSADMKLVCERFELIEVFQ